MNEASLILEKLMWFQSRMKTLTGNTGDWKKKPYTHSRRLYFSTQIIRLCIEKKSFKNIGRQIANQWKIIEVKRKSIKL